MKFDLRTLLSLAWPVILVRASQAVIGFSDALMTAPLGEEALAATTTGAINVFALLILPLGVSFMVQSFAAQFHGKGELRAATRYAWYGLALAFASEVVAILTIPFIEGGLAELAYEQEVRELMTSYLRIRFLAVGPWLIVEVIGNWYGGLGNTRLHMVAGLAAMALNVFLNWVLIFGNLGAPALGVDGAAIASALASSAAAIFLLAFFFFDRTTPKSPFGLGLNLVEFRRFLRFGLPHGVNWFLEFAAVALFLNVFVAELGTVTLAAIMVVFNINSVSFMPGLGLASAGSILVGHAIGAGQNDEVPAITRRTAMVAGAWEGTVGVIYLLFPAALMGLFAPEEATSPELLAIGATMLAMSAAWQLFDAVSMTFGEALRAAGDTAWTMWARIGVSWLLFAPLGYVSVFVFDGGPVALMMTLIIYIAALAVVLYLRFRNGNWRTIGMTDFSVD